MTKTLDELVELVNMWGVDVIHAALAAHTGCTTYAKPDVRKAALTAALRELIADAERYRWLLANYATGDGYSEIDAALNDGEANTQLSPAIDAQRTKASE